LVSKDWENIFPTVMVKRLPREISDHNPLIITFDYHKPLKFLQFRFELNWLDNSNFLVTVEKIWSKQYNARTSLDTIQQKLKLLKQYFKGWGFNLQGELRKRIKMISEELSELEVIEEINDLTHEQMIRKVWWVKESLQLLDQEKTYWVKRCHEQWLLKGDSNTKYFHSIANGRKRKSLVLFLESDGIVIEGNENLFKHAAESYADLFGPAEEHNIHIDNSLWDELEKVSSEDNITLTTPFFEADIK
jgi:hypothetical protein